MSSGIVRVSAAPSAPSASTNFARLRSMPHSSSSSASGTPVHSEQLSMPCVYCTVGHRDVAPFHAGVGAALDEVDARHRRKARDVVHRENARVGDQAVNHQPMLVGIDGGYARMMALEMQARRGDDAEQILQGRESDRRLRRPGEPGALAATDVCLVLRRHAVGFGEDRRAERRLPLGNIRGQVARQILRLHGARRPRRGRRRRARAHDAETGGGRRPRGRLDRP